MGRQLFRADGTYTPSPGATRARVRAVGGGGGGGGAGGGANSAAGGGGAAGIQIEYEVFVPSGLTGGPVTIGTGGTGGTNLGGSGGDGGNSLVTIDGSGNVAPGGRGGQGQTSAPAPLITSGGGFVSFVGPAVDLEASTFGHYGITLSAFIGRGGDGGGNPFSIGGRGGDGGSPGGGIGAGYGAGGGGGYAEVNGSPGGDGRPGEIIIEEWA